MIKVKAKVKTNYNGESYNIGEEFEYDEVKYPRNDLDDIFIILESVEKKKEDKKKTKE